MDYSRNIVEDINHLYTSIYVQENEILTEDDDFIFEDVCSTIILTLLYEGLSAYDVIKYLQNTSEDDIVELYMNSDSSLLTEDFISDQLISEQLELLGEAVPLIGAGLAAGGKLASKVLLGKAARAAATRGLSTVGRGLSTAAKRAVGPGVRKAVGGTVSKLKGAAGAAKGALSKLPGPVKTAGKWALGGAAFEAGAGAVKKMSGGDNDKNSTDSAAKPSPDSTSKQSTDYNSSSNTKVLAKLGGKKGILDKSTGKFDQQKWDGDEKDRYKKWKKINSGSVEESYDSYDIVLDYLFENGHVDTLEEAHYIMLEMDTETIQSILEDFQ
jgi:hypothetical protein